MAYLGVPQSKLENLTTNVQIVNLSASFDGTAVTFNLQDSRGDAVYAVHERALLVTLGGITQKPGVDYTTSGTTITFTTAPVSNLTIEIRKFYGVQRIIGVNDGVISPIKLTTGGPAWNSSGNVTISGDLNVTGAFNSGGNGLFWEDNEKAKFGANNDLEIYHSGANSFIRDTGTGSLFIEGTDLTLRAADSTTRYLVANETNGDVSLFYGNTIKFATKTDGVNITGELECDSLDVSGTSTFQDHINLGDNDRVRFGDSQDLQIYHDGSNSYVTQEGSGALIIRNTTDDNDVLIQSDSSSGGIATYLRCDGSNGEVQLSHYGTIKLSTKSTGVTVTETLTTSGTGGGSATLGSHLDLGDNQKVRFGASDDLQIYHDGSRSVIEDSGSGSLEILASNFVVKNAANNKNYIFGADGGAVTLYHDNSTRLETTATGAKVTGDITANAFILSDDYPTSAPVLDLNFAREKRLDSRITFTRNSIATYFDAESSEVLEENNMDYASDFSQWSKAGGTLSNSSWVRPIPGWDSQQVTLFTEDTGAGTHRIFRSIPNYYYDNDQLNKVYTLSFFAKYSSRQYLQLNASGLNYNARIIFDIQNGYVTDYGSALSAGVIDYGNDWYRCWATLQADTNAPVNSSITCPVGGNSSRSGNGESYTANGSSFYLWGYQVEFSDTLGPFVQTTGKTFRKLGPVIRTVAVDEPRFVYDPSTKESLGLLIEQESTNKHQYTNNLTSAIAAIGITASVSTWSNIARAPNGKLEGGRVKGSGVNDNQRCGFNYSISSGEDGAWSAFLKADPNNSGDIIIQIYSNTFIAGNSSFNINLNDGTSNIPVASSDLFTKIEPYPDGWYRVTMGGTASSSATGSMNINIVSSTSAARGDSSNSDKAYFIWGVQFETGSLNDSTSYIENTSTGTKTRSSELAEVRGSNFSSWFNNTEGTILAEYRGGELTSEIPLHISDESYRSNTSIQIGSSSSGPISGFVTTASINNRGTSEAGWSANTAYPTEGESIKTALTYKHNYAQMVTTDGSGTYTGSVDTSVNLPWLNMMTIGKDSYYGIWNNNPIKRLAFYGTTLTEAQLQNIIKY